jgi:hypothetical protein
MLLSCSYTKLRRLSEVANYLLYNSKYLLPTIIKKREYLLIISQSQQATHNFI